MTEILFCQMVLISCLAVDGTFSIRLRGYIFFSQAVDVGIDNSVEIEFKCSDPYQEVLAFVAEVQNE